MVKEVKPAVLLFLAFSLLTGLVYPLLITGVVQTMMPERAHGSLIVVDGQVIGSELIGQNFSGPGYFHGRPSAVSYAANGSGASNLGPTSSRLMDEVRRRVEQVQMENNLSQNMPVPADLVEASASGLDPHISMDGAMLQVPRIAKARGLPESEVKLLVYQTIEPAQFGILGQERVNVLKLNLALDDLTRLR
ncbi:potassium-transporting ATPase subunit KdpC [Methanothrix sp.]|uniref:potassium-transporting ATPase subunit KdpC n=1 Tax=Methanothrix sp. TaxID=90426 RepID=UPI003BB595D5